MPLNIQGRIIANAYFLFVKSQLLINNSLTFDLSNNNNNSLNILLLYYPTIPILYL